MVQVRRAGAADVETVGELVHALLAELTRPGGTPPALETVVASARTVLAGDHDVWALLAEDAEGRPVGVMTLNACAAIYAGGRFGEISELYVRPDHRSQRVGPALLDAAIELGRERGWERLEVGAPDLPRWERTVAFYLRNDFTEVGPRLRRAL